MAKKNRKPSPSPTNFKTYKINYKGQLTVVYPLLAGSKLGQFKKDWQAFKKAWPTTPELLLFNSLGDEAAASEWAKWAEEEGENVCYLADKVAPSAIFARAVAQAQGEDLLFADGSQGIALSNLLEWMDNREEALAANTIYLGSRKHAGSKKLQAKDGLLLSQLHNSYIQFWTPLYLQDSQAPFYFIAKALGQQLAQLTVSGQQTDLLLMAQLEGISIQEMPIRWRHAEQRDTGIGRIAQKAFAGLLARPKNKVKYFFLNPWTEASKALAKEPTIYRFLYAVSALLILFIMAGLSFQYGITGDEVLQKTYGDNVLAYFESDGKDRACMNQSNLHYYGGLFDYLAAWCNKYLGWFDTYDTRHLLNALFGFLAILFTARLGKVLSGRWSMALLTLVLLALSPRFFGHSMNNPKDIPFAMGYMMGIYYMIILTKQLPRPSSRALLMSALGLGITFSMRSGGILLIPYLGLFMGSRVVLCPQLRPALTQFKIGQLFRYAAILLGVSGLGYWMGTWYWPYAQEDIMNHPLESLSEMTNFSTGIRMLWGGKHLWSDQLPWYYIPTWLGISSPIVVLLGLPLVLLLFFRKVFRKKRAYYFNLVLFTGIFPVAYAVYKESSLYDGMRHFLFIYPILVLAAAYGWFNLIRMIKPAAVRYAAIAGIVGLLALPTAWMFRSHPYQYVYFNEFFGGLEEAYGYYETDYWMTCMRNLSDWLIENEPKVKAGEEVIVATNCAKPVAHYFSDYPNVKVRYVRYHERVKTGYDYLLSYSRFVSHGFLQSETWPPAELVHLEEVDGVPLGAVSKAPNGNKKGELAQKAFKEKRYAEGIALLEEVLAADPKNESAMLVLSQYYPQVGKMEEMKNVLTRMRNLANDYVNGLGMAGVYYLNAQQPDSARYYFERATTLNYKYSFGYFHLANLALKEEKDVNKALSIWADFDKYGGQPAQGYQIAVQVAQQAKNRPYELYFRAKALATAGKHVDAYQLLGQAIAVDPNFEPALKAKKMYDDNSRRARDEEEMARKKGAK